MRFFLCLIDPSGSPIGNDIRSRHQSVPRRRGLSCHWHPRDDIAALVGSDDGSHTSLVVDRGRHVAVGDVALQNRPAVETWLGFSTALMSDLEVVLWVIAAHGCRYIPALLGDFAFLVWDRTTGEAIGACDAFAAKKLYYRTNGSLLAFSSRAELLAGQEGYDAQYLAELIAYCPSMGSRSVYAGVQVLRPATRMVASRGHLTEEHYWSAYDVQPDRLTPALEREAPGVCRQLLAQGVAACIRPGERTWAQLSGGLDSSSVVSMAQWCHEQGLTQQGLDGTVTWVETGGMGADEREFSEAVIQRFDVANVLIRDCRPWEMPLPRALLTDQPSGRLPFWSRERCMCDVVRRAGGRALLTGVGGDQLFFGNMFFFADRISRGQWRSALQEMARRAAMGRASFWELALKNALLPLAPAPLRGLFLSGDGRIPPWVATRAVRAYDLGRRDLASASFAGRWGRKYGDSMALGIAATAATVTPGLIEDSLEVRHPYLYRPLVDWALRLPPELCVRPQARKWVLREAMGGILPEKVRRRVGKGLLGAVLAGSLATQATKLAQLLVDPILGQLGVIDPIKLRAAFDRARHEPDGPRRLYPDVQYTLAIEAWLRAQAGDWPNHLKSTGHHNYH